MTTQQILILETFKNNFLYWNCQKRDLRTKKELYGELYLVYQGKAESSLDGYIFLKKQFEVENAEN